MIEPLSIPDLKLISIRIFNDDRGFFVERYQAQRFRDFGIPPLIQDNHSRSKPGVVRGLHYQNQPSQGKLVGVIRGRIWDVAVDLRKSSPTFGKWEAVELNDRDGRLLWIPPGFAHGFCVLGDEEADVFYKVDAVYNPKGEGGIRFDDPELKIPWPVENPIVSNRDRALPSLSEYSKGFNSAG